MDCNWLGSQLAHCQTSVKTTKRTSLDSVKETYLFQRDILGRYRETCVTVLQPHTVRAVTAFSMDQAHEQLGRRPKSATGWRGELLLSAGWTDNNFHASPRFVSEWDQGPTTSKRPIKICPYLHTSTVVSVSTLLMRARCTLHAKLVRRTSIRAFIVPIFNVHELRSVCQPRK